VVKILRLFLKTFNLVPGEPAISWDLSSLPFGYLVLIVNPIGRILVRWKRSSKNGQDFLPSNLQSAVKMNAYGVATGRRLLNIIDLFCKRDIYTCKWHVRRDIYIWKGHLSLLLHQTYGVATGRRLLNIIGLFCKRALLNRGYSAKQTVLCGGQCTCLQRPFDMNKRIH